MSKYSYYKTLPLILIIGWMSLAIFPEAYAASSLTVFRCTLGGRVTAPGNTCPGTGLYNYSCIWSNGVVTTPRGCGRNGCNSVCVPPTSGNTTGNTTGGTSQQQPTSNNVSKSGGAIKPVSNAKATVNYQSQTTDSSVVGRFDYSKLKPCPPDPNSLTDTNFTTSTTGTPVTTVSKDTTTTQTYTDIDGKMPYYSTTGVTYTGGSPLYGGIIARPSTTYDSYAKPDDQCVVRNYIQCTVNGNTVVDGVNGGVCTRNDPIVRANAAVCPDGYVQVASYDMQPEVKYGSPPPVEFPITSMENFNKYNGGGGYNCNLDTTKTYRYGMCSNYSQESPSSVYVQTTTPANVTMLVGGPVSFDLNYQAGKVVLPEGGSVAGVGKFVALTTNGEQIGYKADGTGTCYSNATCDSSGKIGCALYCGRTWLSMGDANGPRLDSTGAYLACTNNGGAFSVYFHYNYQLMKCTPKSNIYYYSDYAAPRALICARIKSKYDPINKPKPANINTYTSPYTQ